MDTDFRRILLAMVVAMGVFLGYRLLVDKFFPPPPTPETTAQPAPPMLETYPAPPTESVPTGAAPTSSSGPALGQSPASTQYAFSVADDVAPITFGGEPGDSLRAELNPRGGSLVWLDLFSQDEDGQFVQRAGPKTNEPYRLLHAVEEGGHEYYSFDTHRLWVKELDRNWRLDDLTWAVVSAEPGHVVFATTLMDTNTGVELLRVTKTWHLLPNEPIIELTLAVRNRSAGPLTVWIEQDAAIGIPPEHQQYDMRRLLTAQRQDRSVKLNKGYQHSQLVSTTRKGEVQRLDNPELPGAFLWTVLANKYFGVYTHPRPREGQGDADYIARVDGMVAAPDAAENPGDLIARLTTRPIAVAPNADVSYPFEVYAGPKDESSLAKIKPAYADPNKLYYHLAQSADSRCCCTFGWLRSFMVWLLETIHSVVCNYGVAIIILVVIIRMLLHPLSVFQQKSMFRMQESMARMQPRMQAVKERYPNDKTKQNQEMMKLWGEEGVNPMAPFVSFIPLFIQMPILVALWTALNTDINLRHAPFFVLPWWIQDLSAPDQFLTFSPIRIPLLSWFLGDIDSLNLLPILMGVSMWLQQRYMPKPHLKAKLEAARQAPQSEQKKGRPTPEDQIRQQQMMMYLMAFIFPLMFYKWPAGLNLYWMATNVFGIGESLLIRRQIDEERKNREKQGPRPPRKPGVLGRFFKHIASQAEQLQRKADELQKDMPSKDRKKKS